MYRMRGILKHLVVWKTWMPKAAQHDPHSIPCMLASHVRALGCFLILRTPHILAQFAFDGSRARTSDSRWPTFPPSSSQFRVPDLLVNISTEGGTWPMGGGLRRGVRESRWVPPFPHVLALLPCLSPGPGNLHKMCVSRTARLGGSHARRTCSRALPAFQCRTTRTVSSPRKLSANENVRNSKESTGGGDRWNVLRERERERDHWYTQTNNRLKGQEKKRTKKNGSHFSRHLKWKRAGCGRALPINGWVCLNYYHTSVVGYVNGTLAP